MFVKSDIRKITVAVEKDRASDVYLALGRAGIVHLSRYSGKDTPSANVSATEESLVRDIVAATDVVLHALQLAPQEAYLREKPLEPHSDAILATGYRKTIERAVRVLARLQKETENAARQITYAEVLGSMGADSGILKNTPFLKMTFGTVEEAAWETPIKRPFRLARAGSYVLGLAHPQYDSEMFEFLKTRGFVNLSADVRDVGLESLKKRKSNLIRRREAIDAYLERLKKDKEQEIKDLNSAYRGYDEVLKAKRLSQFSARAVFITGWMDAADREKLVAVLRVVCGNRFVVSEKKDPNAPVRLLNLRWLRPFELLVKTMGIPANSEIDPTPLAAVTFVLMFGLMFGDLGQGGILAAGGWFLRRFGKKKAKDELEQAGGILIVCGLFAALCGWLYGSVFSYEHLLPALWFHPTAHIMKLFGMTILMGAVFIMVGLGVNILNSILNTDYAEAFLEKRGLAVLILYVSILVFAVRYVMTGRMPAAWAIAVFAGLPLVLFSLRGVLGTALFHIEKIHSLPEYVVETVMEIVEIFLGLFANTISFIRVGAFALSHAGLSIVTYTLAGMADPALKSAGAILIIVVGNIFIIGFEGLICGIQSMRLEYYEFFNKFFRGDGVVFSPFTLKAKASEV